MCNFSILSIPYHPCVVELSGKDNSLDATDIMIISHVLSDTNSKFFFTVDGNILENAAIIDLEKDVAADPFLYIATFDARTKN